MKTRYTLFFLLPTFPLISQNPPGVFTQSADIGPVLHKGNTVYDAQAGEYRLSGSGANIEEVKSPVKKQEQRTFDEYNNWFPHVSPDGRWIVFLSYMPDVQADDHPFYKNVYLRIMPAGGGQPKVIAYFYGGQGSINVPSWSPDSRRVAFVSNTEIENDFRLQIT